MAKYTDGVTWELPFGPVPELELQAEFGSLALVPVEAGAPPRLELTRASAERIAVHVDKYAETVRVRLEPNHPFHWFGGWDARATVYVPRDVHAHVQTNAGSISVRDLQGCELGIKANAGKIDLLHVHGVLHLGADAGSVTGQDVGGYLNVETQAGSVRLAISDLQPGEHEVRATMGSVRLELARGLDVCIDTRTSLGAIRNEFPSRQTSAAKLLLSTEMGSLRIEESSALFARPVGQPSAAAWPSSASPEPDASDAAPVTSTSAATTAAPDAASDEPAEVAAEAPAEPSDLELERILKMVEAGELSAQDADELLRAMGRV